MLPRGTNLGPYELIAALGAGGMGEVYRARDPRLGREVAVKVLPALLAGDSERLRRFEQEARAAGQLNHPNVLAVFDLGLHDGSPYLVAELLEGQSLRDRLRAERLPTRKAVDYAIQIARGLAAAHGRGIAHRDLKPENLFVTRDGHVKILDFGLAKLTRPESAAAAEASTLTALTDAGVMLGTIGYMSPEQARGQPTDHRTDIFGFGAILYEMLSGRPAFHGGTPADTITAILKEHPPSLTEIVGGLPPALDRIVSHCLEKHPDERFHSMRDVVFDLEGLSTASSTPAAVPGARLSRRWLAGIAGVLLFIMVALGWMVYRRLAASSATRPPISFRRLTDFVGMEQTPAVSPDGRSVAFSGGEGTPHIWVRLLAGGPPLKVTRDDVPHLYPRWSPDSASLIYFSPSPGPEVEGGLYEVPALGGTARRLVASTSGGDISHDGTRLAYFRSQEDRVELVVADRDGGDPRTIARLPLESAYCCPRWSPDGHFLAYQAGKTFFDFDVFAVPAAGGEPRPLTSHQALLNGFSWLPDASGIVYSSSRGTTMLYLPTMNLWSVKLDGSRLRALTFGDVSYSDPDVDAQGHIFATRTRAEFNIWRFPLEGLPADNVRRALQVTRQTGHVQTPSVSPGDRELVYLSDNGGRSNLWVMRLDTGETRQITFEQDPRVSIGAPVWSPDGRNITFFSRRPDTINGDQWLVSPDGSNLRRLVREGGWAAWSHDGKWLYYTPVLREGQQYRILRTAVDGGETVVVRSDTARMASAPAPDGTLYYIHPPRAGGGEHVEIRVAAPGEAASRVLVRLPEWRVPQMQPVLSPDGKWLALMLNDGHSTNLYLQPTAGGPLRPVTDFGSIPTDITRRVSWSSDSRFIYAAVGHPDADIVVLDHLLD